MNIKSTLLRVIWLLSISWFVGLIMTGCQPERSQQGPRPDTSSVNENLIGGDTDEQGCLVAAGFSWNENVKACIREWELNDDQKKAAKSAVEYLNPMKGVTIINVDGLKCPGCFQVKLILGLNSGDEEVSIRVENGQVIMDTFEACANAGNPIMESYPRQCSVNGQTFVEKMAGNEVVQASRTSVELDIFSGRPNPTWTLEPALASDLQDRIARLNSTSQTLVFPQNLGYRGFIVQFLNAGTNAIQTVHACSGIIKVTNATGIRYFLDPQKQIELWLLASSASAQPPLSDDLVAQIVKEINAP